MTDHLDAADYLDVRQLLLLSLLCSTQSVTRTAERLGQTQPTVSVGLRELRRLFNDPLFVRTKTGMSPTPRAEVLVARAREILDALQALSSEAVVFDPASASRTFRICVPDSSHMVLLPRLLLHIRSVAPNIRLEAIPVDKLTAQLLQAGEADLAIGGFVEGMEAGFYQQVLYEQDFVCLASATHPRIRDELSLGAYEVEAHIEVSYGKVNDLIETALKAQGTTRRSLLSLPGFLGIAPIVCATDMIATVPRHVAEGFVKNFALQVLPCPVSIPSYKIRQYWHARVNADGANRWLREVCAGLLSEHRRADE